MRRKMKKMDKTRPSLWTFTYAADVFLYVLYPDGRVEVCLPSDIDWYVSTHSGLPPNDILNFFRSSTNYTFVSYL